MRSSQNLIKVFCSCTSHQFHFSETNTFSVNILNFVLLVFLYQISEVDFQIYVTGSPNIRFLNLFCVLKFHIQELLFERLWHLCKVLSPLINITEKSKEIISFVSTFHKSTHLKVAASSRRWKTFKFKVILQELNLNNVAFQVCKIMQAS